MFWINNMDLNNVYALTNSINEEVVKGNLNKNDLNDIVISVLVEPNILYGIDKEFYRISHEGSSDGFTHTSEVRAKLDRINFIFKPKK